MKTMKRVKGPETIVGYFLKNGNEPTYEKEIADDLKTVSRTTVGKWCEMLQRLGILSSEQKKPWRQKDKTDYWYLKKEYDAFFKISEYLLKDAEIKTRYGIIFISSEYARDFLNENLIRHLFFRWGAAIRKEYQYMDIKESDLLKMYGEIFARVAKIHYFHSGTHMSEVAELEKRFPGERVGTYPKSIILLYPILPIDIDYDEKKKAILRVNQERFVFPGLTDARLQFIKDLTEHSDIKKNVINQYYTNEEKARLTNLFDALLCLIQNSPTALSYLLFEGEKILRNFSQGHSFEFRHGQKIILKENDPEKPPMTGPFFGIEINAPSSVICVQSVQQESEAMKFILKNLVFCCSLDLIEQPKLSPYTLADKIDTSASIFIAKLKDGRTIKIDFSMVADKDGVYAYSEGDIEVS